MTAIVFPLQYDESSHRFEVILSDGIFEILQSLLFSAEKFINATELLAHSGHRFTKIESFRNTYLLDESESIKLDLGELHLLHMILNPYAGYMPSAGESFQDPSDLLDDKQEQQLKALAEDLKRIFEIIRWVPDSKKQYD